MTCSTIATVAIRKIADEYLTAAAGPTSHSPPPIDVAAMIAPGPMTRNMLRTVNGGGAGRSATAQRGSSPWNAAKASSSVLGNGGMARRIPQLDDLSRRFSATVR